MWLWITGYVLISLLVVAVAAHLMGRAIRGCAVSDSEWVNDLMVCYSMGLLWPLTLAAVCVALLFVVPARLFAWVYDGARTKQVK